MGSTRASRVVFDALVENRVEWPETPVFGEGAKDNTRGRVCSPRFRDASAKLDLTAYWAHSGLSVSKFICSPVRGCLKESCHA